MTMGLKEAIQTVEDFRPSFNDDSLRIVLDAARAYDHHRSYIDRLQVERDERHKTCVAQANVIAELNGTIERLQSGRDEAICALSAEKATNERLHASRELALAELDEKAKLIAELQASLEDSTEREAMWRVKWEATNAAYINRASELADEVTALKNEIRQWERAAREPAVDWRKTLDATKLQLIAYIAAGEGPYIGDSEDAIELIARWEPKS